MSILPITCPACAHTFDAIQSLAEGELREYLELLAGFGSLRSTVEAYLDLFRAAPDAAMRVPTRLRLVRELRRLWDEKSFVFNRHLHHVSQAQISEAITQTVRAMQGKAGVVNHNYLKKVMLGLLDKEERLEKRLESKDEQALEARRRAGQHRQESPPAPTQQTGDDKPLWEQPLEDQVVALACVYKSPLLRGAGWRVMVEQSLIGAGVNLEPLQVLAKRAESASDLAGRGAELLSRCRAAGNDLVPAAQCLPGIGGK
ncbi:MAG: hypothetical protein V1806_17375 [Pseudomonadota bacterium]